MKLFGFVILFMFVTLATSKPMVVKSLEPFSIKPLCECVSTTTPTINPTYTRPPRTTKKTTIRY